MGRQPLNTPGTVSDTAKGGAIGTGSNSLETGIAVGNNANAVTGGSIAIGENSVAGKDNMDNPQVSNNRTTVGKRNDIAIGAGAVATGGRVISIGENAGNYTTDNWNIYNVNIGADAGAGSKRDYSVAIGYNAGYVSTTALQTTQQAVDDGNRTPSVYIGEEAGKDTVSYGNIGIGQDAGRGLSTTDTGRSIMIGNGAGAGMTSTGDTVANSVYLGDNTTATKGSKVGTFNTTITGDPGVTTTAGDTGTVSSVEIGIITYGNFAGAAANGVVSVGASGSERRIQNVAAGETSATSTDAINGSQLYATNQQVNQNTSAISTLGRDVKKLDTRLDKVGAGAAALAALHPLDFDPDAKWDVTAGYGNYAGENAVAIGAFYRPNEDLMFSVGSSIGNGENMINAGVSVKVGANKGVTNSRVAMAKEIQDMKVAMKMLIEENKVIKANQRALNAGIKNVTFPDVPEGHWAYDYVKSLADKGLLEGYPDGTFKGNQPMTRYEIAAMVYRALQNGAPIDGKMGQALDEFENELDKLANSDRFRVDRVSGDDNKRHKIERVRVNSKDTKEVKRDIYGTTLEK